jgi:hypothetical protein
VEPVRAVQDSNTVLAATRVWPKLEIDSLRIITLLGFVESGSDFLLLLNA